MKFQMPLSGNPRISQGCRTGHTALDYAVINGTNLYAAQSGRVSYVKNDMDLNQTGCQWGYGNRIKIDHGDGWLTLYAHLHPNILVRVGENVSVGQRIGFTDNTGCSSGPHLHFEIRKNNSVVCPDNYLVDDLEPPEPVYVPDFPKLPEAMSLVTLNVRIRPKVGAKILYKLTPNETFGAISETVYPSGDRWLQIGHKSYCARIYNGNVYVKFLEEMIT